MRRVRDKQIIKGIVDYSRSTHTHFVTKTNRGVAKWSRLYYVSEYEVLRSGSEVFEKN